ncbi:MAG: DegV family EDD domain-containing protein [Dehalococcoidia bacterium]|nr:DegV family EDD domain-containing protein [Dehalococcoidia bacterium]
MRRKVAVIVDAPAAVPQELVDSLDIGIVPLYAIVDGQDYPETEVDMEWLLQRLEQRGNIPTTSASSIGDFLKAYEWAAERAESAVSLHMTSKFTKTYENALAARKMILEKYPGMRIEAVDTETVEAGEMPMAIAAARLAAAGADFDDVVRKVYEVRDATRSLYCFESLFYRDKGGRIFKAKPWAESENNGGAGFKAMIEVDHSSGGTVSLVTRARAKKQLISKMASIAAEQVGDGRLSGAIVHIRADQDVQCLKHQLEEKVDIQELVVSHGRAVTAIQNGLGFVTFGFHRV